MATLHLPLSSALQFFTVSIRRESGNKAVENSSHSSSTSYIFKLLNDNTLHYIILETIYSGLSKSNLNNHYGDAATEQCLRMIAEINAFLVSDE